MNTAKYESPRVLRSILRQVPMMNLETVREKAKEAASAISDCSGRKVRTRVVFRGPREWHPMHTIKNEAVSFDVYVKTFLPRSLSRSERTSICEHNREEVKSMLTDIDQISL